LNPLPFKKLSEFIITDFAELKKKIFMLAHRKGRRFGFDEWIKDWTEFDPAL
jgi:hypothetical protein